jgi:hypothetical protein
MDGLWWKIWCATLTSGKIMATLALVRGAIDGASIYLCSHVEIKKRVYSFLMAMMEDPSVYHTMGGKLLHVTRCGTTRCAKAGCGAELYVSLHMEGIMIDTRRKLKITTIMAEDWMACTQASRTRRSDV